MKLENNLRERSGSQCELCATKEGLTVYTVPPAGAPAEDNSLLVCDTCLSQIEAREEYDENHWRCLSDSMWSPFPPVQVVAWRVLSALKDSTGWAGNLLDTMYLDEETQSWAEALGGGSKHVDMNGVPLSAGDTVTLIKDLPVKGCGFTAKRGTAIRNISLPADDPEHILGKVNGQQIYIVTKYLKKS